MTQPSTAIVKLGTKEYFIDTAATANAYRSSGEIIAATPFASHQESGVPQALNLIPETPTHGFTNWLRGENNKFYDEEDPYRYDSGLCNPRRAGQLTGPPTKATATMAVSTNRTMAFFAASDSSLWAVSDRKTYSSTTGTSWTSRTNGAGASQYATAVAADHKYIYVAYYDGSDHEIIRVTTTNNGDAFSPTVSSTPIAAMAYLAGYLYAWYGTGNVRTYDTTLSPTVSSVKIYVAHLELSTTPNVGMTTGDGSVWLYSCLAGNTFVHEITGENRVGHSFDDLHGVTATAMGYGGQVLYVAGTYGNQAGLWGWSTRKRTQEFLGYFRETATPNTTLTPASISVGPGDQMLIGMQSGEVFVYSREQDAISELDVHSSSGNLADVATFKDKRLGLYLDTGNTQLVSAAWNRDDQTTTASGNCTEPAWHFNYTHENKVLLGHHVQFAPISGSETITVSYKLDEAASFTDHTQITSATTGASTGDVYLTASTNSSTIKGKFIRTKYTWTNGAVIHAVTARTRIVNYRDLIELFLRIRREGTQPRRRPTNRQDDAWTLLDYLLNTSTGLLRAKNVFSLTDAEGNTQDVTCEGYDWLPKRFFFRRSGGNQGTLHIMLRPVAP